MRTVLDMVLLAIMNWRYRREEQDLDERDLMAAIERWYR